MVIAIAIAIASTNTNSTLNTFVLGRTVLSLVRVVNPASVACRKVLLDALLDKAVL